MNVFINDSFSTVTKSRIVTVGDKRRGFQGLYDFLDMKNRGGCWSDSSFLNVFALRGHRDLHLRHRFVSYHIIRHSLPRQYASTKRERASLISVGSRLSRYK